MKCKRWETELSNCKSLTFNRLVDHGLHLLFQVKGDHGAIYEVELTRSADFAYAMSDAMYMTHDVNLHEIGWSYIVENGIFSKMMAPMIERGKSLGKEPYVHYVISTCDQCLELLSITPPVVRKLSD